MSKSDRVTSFGALSHPVTSSAERLLMKNIEESEIKSLKLKLIFSTL